MLLLLTPSVETGGILVPRVFVLMTGHEGEGSGVENKLSGRVSGRQNRHRGQTSEHAQCTRTRSPAAKISRAKI